MDDHLKLVVLFCLLGIFPVQGYIFRVKSETSEKGVCLTDEQSSTIAPIQPLNSALKTSSENGWLASLDENIDEFECIPNYKCKNWNWAYSSLERVDSIFGRDVSSTSQTSLWNYSPEFKTDGKEEFISREISGNHYHYTRFWYTVAFSILAQEAQILFTSAKQWQGKSGILLSFEATGEVWISVCSVMFAKNSTCSQKLPGSSKHDLGKKWVGIKLSTSHKGKYWIQINDDPTITVNMTENLQYLTFQSKIKPGLFKLLQYDALAIYKRPLTFNSPSIALLKPRTIAFTFLQRTKMNYSVVIDGYAQNATTTSLKKNFQYIDYLEIEKTSSPLSNLTISLTPAYNTNHNFLTSVSMVSYKGYGAIYMNGDLSACQIMSTGEVTSNIQNDTVAESLPEIPVNDICNKLNAPHCHGVEACSPDGCFCFSGHTRSPLDRKCTQKCNGTRFGPNCVYIASSKVHNFYVNSPGCPNCEKTLEAPAISQNSLEKIEASDNDSYLTVLLLSTTVLCLLQLLVMVFFYMFKS